MRRAVVRCAAANDDEDLGGLFREKRRRKTEAEGAEESARGKKGREKAFAWMDSEDEAASDAEQRSEEEPAEAQEDDQDEGEVSAEQLDTVQSFGRMMLLSAPLRRRLRESRLETGDAVAACRALARSRFFDSDLLDDLCTLLARLLSSNQLDRLQANDVIMCLKALNYYNKAVFSAAAGTFKTKVGEIDAGMRSSWLEAFRTFRHDGERDFLQLLEIPPLPIISPSYRKVRCWHFSQGRCELGATCTFLHDLRAPMSLADVGKEDAWRTRSTMLTQDQKALGQGAYGTGPLGHKFL